MLHRKDYTKNKTEKVIEQRVAKMKYMYTCPYSNLTNRKSLYFQVYI